MKRLHWQVATKNMLTAELGRGRVVAIYHAADEPTVELSHMDREARSLRAAVHCPSIAHAKRRARAYLK